MTYDEVNLDMLDESLPVMFQHCAEVYDRMLQEAKPKTVNESEQIVLMIWEGFLTRLITQDLRHSVPYYTAITQALRSMGCIEQIRRGGGSAPSQFVLHKAPTAELWSESSTAFPSSRKTTGKVNAIEQQIRTLNTRLNNVEVMQEQLMKAAGIN